MKKLLTIMLILFVGFAAFAQDSVVVYYADDSIPSQDYNMFYAGLEFGAGSINNLIFLPPPVSGSRILPRMNLTIP